MDRLKRFVDYAPYLVFIIFIIFSIFLYSVAVKTLENEIANTFRITTRELANSVESRMRMYEQILRGGEGLFEANRDIVTRQMWLDYIISLELERNYPGIQAIGFAKIVKKEDAQNHINEMRGTGLSEYRIKPSADRDRMAVVTLMYPETKENLRVLGFDLSSEPVRAAMFAYAEESKSTGISGKMVLKQEIDESKAPAGILMAKPMYRDGELYGYIAAPFRVNRLMRGIFGDNMKGIDFEIYDSESKPENLMFSTVSKDNPEKKYICSIPLDVYGRVWVLNFKANPAFFLQFDRGKPLLILFGGLVTGALLSMLVFLLLKTRSRAYEMAERMSRKFNESEERYRRTFEQAGVGIVMTSLNGNIMKANRFFKDITGYGEDEMLSLNFCSMFDESFFEEMQNMLTLLTEHQAENYYTEKQITVKAKTGLWVGLTVSAFIDAKGVPLYLIIIVEDISKRKKAEEAIVSLSMRQAAILDNSLVAIMQLNKDVIEWVNSAFVEMFGFSQEEVIGLTARIMSETDAKHDMLVKSIMSSDSYQRYGVVRTQAQFVKKDGTLVWADISGKLIESGVERISIWVLNDITDRIRAEQMLKNLNTGLETKVREETLRRLEQERLLMHQSRLAAMGEMIGAIAHQWRQPLNILSLMIQNISDDYYDKTLDNKGMDEFSSHSQEQLRYMSDTIDDFRNFFRSDKDITLFSPFAQVENVSKLLHSQLEARSIELNISQRGAGLVKGIANEFAQVVLNLVNNSKDAFADVNRDRRVIDITVDCGGGNIEIAVRDNAGGIPAGIMEKVFDPYFTTKGPDKGTGIGLYMSKIIIHDHFGGNLTYKNISDGCEFVISLPKAADSE